MKKKVVSMLMCAALGATLLAGCGSGSTDAGSSDASATTDDGAADAVAGGRFYGGTEGWL